MEHVLFNVVELVMSLGQNGVGNAGALKRREHNALP